MIDGFLTSLVDTPGVIWHAELQICKRPCVPEALNTFSPLFAGEPGANCITPELLRTWSEEGMQWLMQNLGVSRITQFSVQDKGLTSLCL